MKVSVKRNPEFVMKCLDAVLSNPELNAEFRKVYGTDEAMIRAGIKDNHIKKSAVKLIVKLGAPHVPHVEVKEVVVDKDDSVLIAPFIVGLACMVMLLIVNLVAIEFPFSACDDFKTTSRISLFALIIAYSISLVAYLKKK